MKKTLLSLAFAAIGLIAFTSSAQQFAAKTQDDTAKKECCKKQPCNKNLGMANPMAGIELTAEQQASLKALNEKFYNQKKENRQEAKEENKGEKKGYRETKKAYLTELQSILTPEQYVTYLENQVLNMGSRQDMHKKHNKEKKDMKDRKDRKAKKHQKSEKRAKAKVETKQS